MRNVVVFPQPLGSRMTTNLPFSIASETSVTAWCEPYAFRTSWSRHFGEVTTPR